MLIGGVAAGIWGEPRYTIDADFIVVLSHNQTGPFLRAAKIRGFTPDEQVVLMNLQISGVARLPYHERHADLIVGESDFDQSALDRRRSVTIFDRTVWIASPEDIILYKLVALRDRDIDDIRRIITRQGKNLDLRYLKKWSAILSDKLKRPELDRKLRELLNLLG